MQATVAAVESGRRALSEELLLPEVFAAAVDEPVTLADLLGGYLADRPHAPAIWCSPCRAAARCGRPRGTSATSGRQHVRPSFRPERQNRRPSGLRF
jgi:hypothetical protein